MNLNKQVLKRKKGISLIETMIAVTIIAILQVAVLANIKSSMDKLKKITVQASEREMTSGLINNDQYNKDDGILELIEGNSQTFKRLSESLASSDIEEIIENGSSTYITLEQLTAIVEGNFVVDKGGRVIVLPNQNK